MMNKPDAPLHPKVGLAVYVTSSKHPQCVLLGKRKGSHGANTHSPPGGHLEFGETWEECARREVLEETGLKLREVYYGTVVNAVWAEGEKNFHYISLVMTAEVDGSYKKEPENSEPHKCEGWEWHQWGQFPENIFSPLKTIVNTGYSPFSMTKSKPIKNDLVNVEKPDHSFRPRVGLAVFITSKKYPGCVLLGRRKGSFGESTYALPGGHLEFSETWEECARREVLEETGLKLKAVHHGTTVNAVWSDNKGAFHYLDLIMTAELNEHFKEEPENTEPDKCEGWEWHKWGAFPENLFPPLKTVLSSGYSPF